MASKWVMPLLTWRRSIAVLMLVPPLHPHLSRPHPQCALVFRRLLALSRPPHHLVPSSVGPLSVSTSARMASTALRGVRLVPTLLLEVQPARRAADLPPWAMAAYGRYRYSGTEER